MEICINGENVKLVDGMTIYDLLETRGLIGKRLAVERNGEIVPKGMHPQTELHDGDRVEIVVAVGGG